MGIICEWPQAKKGSSRRLFLNNETISHHQTQAQFPCPPPGLDVGAGAAGAGLDFADDGLQPELPHVRAVYQSCEISAHVGGDLSDRAARDHAGVGERDPDGRWRAAAGAAVAGDDRRLPPL